MARNTDAHDPAPHTHRCPVKGCTAPPIVYDKLMCRDHWRMVAIHLRLQLIVCWNDGQPCARYPAVRATAIASVDALLGRP